MISKKIGKKCHDTGGKAEENEEKLDSVEMIYDLSTLNMGHDEHYLLFHLIFSKLSSFQAGLHALSL